MRSTHHLAEPAGAAALAGLMIDQRDRHNMGRKRVGVIMTGGNMDAPMLAEILAGRTPSP